MCLVLIWGLCSAHVFLFIASTMLVFIVVGEFVVSIIAFTSKYETRLLLLEQLPKLGKNRTMAV
jgi:type IV secretory pathway VirB3-like protein